MNIGLSDLWGEIEPQIQAIHPWCEKLVPYARRICETEYRTEEAARFALQQLAWHSYLIWSWDEACRHSGNVGAAVDKAVKRKIDSLHGAKMPGDCERQEMDGQLEQDRYLEFPVNVQEQIFSELPPLSYLPATCKKLKANHDTFCVQLAQKLRILDARSLLLSGLGITFPEQLTGGTALQLFKTVADKICIIYRTVPPYIYKYKGVGELLRDPDSLKKFLETVYSFSLKQIFGSLAGVAEELSPDDSRPFIDDWLKNFDHREITHLGLGEKFLVYFPKEICFLPNLEQLDLGFNKIMSIPSEIGKLVNLKCLRLPRNILSFIPPEIGNLKELTELSLWRNKLSFIPYEIGNLEKIEILDLSSNELSSIPSKIGTLPKLRGLDFGNNPLKEIPDELKKWYHE